FHVTGVQTCALPISLREATASDRYYIKEGQLTAVINFDREPRFYGSLGFDRGIWFGQGNYDEEDSYWLQLKRGEFGGKTQAGWHAVTGYYAKKLVNVTNNNTTNSSDRKSTRLNSSHVKISYAV